MDTEKASEDAVEEKVEEYQMLQGAKVLWPADMPDDILDVCLCFYYHVSFSL